jgi:hypothetical protein
MNESLSSGSDIVEYAAEVRIFVSILSEQRNILRWA